MGSHKIHPCRLACVAIAALPLPGCASRPVPDQLGELPPGYVSRQELEAVRMEIVVSLLVDSAVAAEYIPAGLTPATLQRIATQDSATAQFLASRPHMKSAVSGALVFSALDSVTIDDREPMANVAAVWWLAVRSGRDIDDRALGRNWVEAAFWTLDSVFVRLVRPYAPQVRQAPVTIEEVEGDWRAELSLPEATVRVRCTPTGRKVPEDYPLPDYTTVWSAGAEPSTFVIYSGYGHLTQNCTADWTAAGEHVLVDVINATLADPPPWMFTVLQDGWRARAGMYRR